MIMSAPVAIKRWISWTGEDWVEDISKSGSGYSGTGASGRSGDESVGVYWHLLSGWAEIKSEKMECIWVASSLRSKIRPY